jgi:hypothetical protein
MKKLIAALSFATASQTPNLHTSAHTLSRGRHQIFHSHVVLVAVIALVFTGSLIPHFDHITHLLIFAVTGAKTINDSWTEKQ